MGPPAAALVAHATDRYLRLMMIMVSALFILVEVRTAPWSPAPLGPHRPTRVIAAVTNAVLVLFVAFVVLRVIEADMGS